MTMVEINSKSLPYQMLPKMLVIKTKSNILTGFRAGVYKKDNNIIIVYRGTDTPIDLMNNDINMVQKCIPQQIKDARKFYKEIRIKL